MDRRIAFNKSVVINKRNCPLSLRVASRVSHRLFLPFSKYWSIFREMNQPFFHSRPGEFNSLNSFGIFPFPPTRKFVIKPFEYLSIHRAAARNVNPKSNPYLAFTVIYSSCISLIYRATYMINV